MIYDLYEKKVLIKNCKKKYKIIEWFLFDSIYLIYLQ